MQPPYPLRSHTFRHHGFHAELIAPRDPETLIDDSEFNTDERLPYWAELWPSAVGLACELVENPPAATRILELGCGLALPSLVLRRQGREVVASDWYPEALEFAVENARRNRIPPPETLLLDWRHPDPSLHPFDLVIGADLLYEQRNAESLADLLPRVTAPGGRVLIADPGRSHAERFLRLMRARGWSVAETARRQVDAVAVRLYQLGPKP